MQTKRTSPRAAQASAKLLLVVSKRQVVHVSYLTRVPTGHSDVKPGKLLLQDRSVSVDHPSYWLKILDQKNLVYEGDGADVYRQKLQPAYKAVAARLLHCKCFFACGSTTSSSVSCIDAYNRMHLSLATQLIAYLPLEEPFPVERHPLSQGYTGRLHS